MTVSVVYCVKEINVIYIFKQFIKKIQNKIMIDKLLLNNQIITNKKKIQQARIQTINKLVQKIRKLKTLNEKKPQNAKITKNLEKIPKIMMCLKKVKVVEIIRKILTFNKKPSAILTNGQASPEDIAIALLATNKILTAIVNTLKTLLSLDDSNPGWQNDIMELSKRKKKILESSNLKKNKSLKNVKKQPLAVKKLPWKEENLDTTQSAKSEDEIIDPAPANGWVVEPINDSVKKPSSVNKPKQVKKTQFDKNIPASKKQLQSEKLDESIQSSSTKPVTTVDSFFFTETGDNYLSTVVIDRVQPEPIQDGLIRRERRDNTIRPNKKYNNFRRQSAPNAGFENKRQFVQQNPNGRIDKRQSFAANSNVKPQLTTPEKLHPSWAAKQKLKPSITQFKGQKITFDDDGQKAVVKSFNKSENKQASHQKNKPDVQSQENIHPSWAAKQKQKLAITEFKGTKIKFDD